MFKNENHMLFSTVFPEFFISGLWFFFIPLLKSPALLVKTSWSVDHSFQKTVFPEESIHGKTWSVVRCYIVQIPWLNNLRLPEICLLQSNKAYKTQLWFYNFIIYDFITYKRCANKSSAFFVMMYMILTIVLWYIVIINGSLRQRWFLKMLEYVGSPKAFQYWNGENSWMIWGYLHWTGNLHRSIRYSNSFWIIYVQIYVYIIWFTHWGSLT